jgi:DNA polymerase-3 subunit delta'
MKTKTKKVINISTHPKESEDFIGHERAIDIIVQTIKSDKIPQAWLFAGPKGIGKATLAYRFARTLLAGNHANGENLYLSPDDPTFTKIANNSHSDLLVIEALEGEDTIKIDEIRNINKLFRLTASQTKNRIVIIDSADDMNVNAANALLKMLEEPPHKAIIILITHNIGRLLPTVRSRCRTLNMHALSSEQARKILKQNISDVLVEELDSLTYLANGSPGLAIELYNNNALEIYKYITDILKDTPNIKSNKIQKLADLVCEKDNKSSWSVMTYLFNSLLFRIIKSAAQNSNLADNAIMEEDLKRIITNKKSLEDLINISEEVGTLFTSTAGIHLDKRAVIISIFEYFKK